MLNALRYLRRPIAAATCTAATAATTCTPRPAIHLPAAARLALLLATLLAWRSPHACMQTLDKGHGIPEPAHNPTPGGVHGWTSGRGPAECGAQTSPCLCSPWRLTASLTVFQLFTVPSTATSSPRLPSPCWC